MIEDPKDGEPVTPCMDVYKAKIQTDGSLDKLKLSIVVRGDLQNNEMIGGTDDLISTETLHDIRDGNQTHPKN